MTKNQKNKLNKLFDDNVVTIALDHSDFTALAHDHWKDYLQENYKDPAEWAQENLSPDEIKDILQGKEIVGADFKKEDNNKMRTKIYFLLTNFLPPLWTARLDNSIACSLWRKRQLAKVRVFIKRTTRRIYHV